MIRHVTERFITDLAQLECGHFKNTEENVTTCETCSFKSAESVKPLFDVSSVPLLLTIEEFNAAEAW